MKKIKIFSGMDNLDSAEQFLNRNDIEILDTMFACNSRGHIMFIYKETEPQQNDTK